MESFLINLFVPIVQIVADSRFYEPQYNNAVW